MTGNGDHLQTNGAYDFEYNDEGNVIQRTDTTTDEIWLYAFDHNNRLTQADHKPDAVSAVDLSVAFSYDALGNRISKSVDPDGAGITSATVEKFGYDAHGNPWADLDAGGSLTTRRFYTDAVDALFARMGTGDDEDWYLTDRLGSVRDLIDDTGTAFNHLDWGSYGKLVTETGTGSDRYGWTSRERDVEIDLQYNRARYYDWETGRWISQDPIGFDAGDGNLYRYVVNNPINNTDPLGLWPEPSSQADYLYELEKMQRKDKWRKEWDELNKSIPSLDLPKEVNPGKNPMLKGPIFLEGISVPGPSSLDFFDFNDRFERIAVAGSFLGLSSFFLSEIPKRVHFYGTSKSSNILSFAARSMLDPAIGEWVPISPLTGRPLAAPIPGGLSPTPTFGGHVARWGTGTLKYIRKGNVIYLGYEVVSGLASAHTYGMKKVFPDPAERLEVWKGITQYAP